MQLNEMQIKAVEHRDGPLLIVAGAGSGKTTVLSYRAKALMQKGVAPENILCITFTNKAVNELKSRVVAKAGEGAEKVNVATFHAFSRGILEKYFGRDFSVTHTSESRQLVKKIIDEMQLTEETKEFLVPGNIMKLISTFKGELVSADFFLNKQTLKEYIDGQQAKKILHTEVGSSEKLKAFIKVYQEYEKRLNGMGKIDVDDMLLLAVRIFAEHPTALLDYQKQYTYLMIDEYQDTNRAQYILTKMLAKQNRNIVAVGDDFQSIYKFRGSDMRNILNFGKDYPECIEIMLEENYRSTKLIVRAANQIIAHNQEQKKKTLYTALEEGDKIKVHVAENSIRESQHVANEIKRLVSKGYAYRDIAVFYRNNADSTHFETVFPNENIPYQITKESSFFERKEIKDILSYLQFSVDTMDTFSFITSVKYPKRGIGKVSVERIIDRASNGDIYSVLRMDNGLNQKATQGINEYIGIVDDIKHLANVLPVSELIRYTIDRTKYEEAFSDLEVHLKKEKRDYLKLLITVASEMQHEVPDMTLGDFLKGVTKREVDKEILEEESFDKVNLLTVHSSKGLEFPVVFIIGMKEQGFPSKFATTNEAIEEERRLCYVAFTRAKKELFVSYPIKSVTPSEENPKEKIEVTNKKSRFLTEFDVSLTEEL